MLCAADDDLFTGGDVERRERVIFETRIKERMKATGRDAKALSRAIGRGDSYISDLLRGRNKDPSQQMLNRIAQDLQCDLDYLLGRTNILYGSPPPLRDSIPYAGIAEAGAFRTMTTKRDTRTISHPRSSLYPDADHIYFDVRSDEMNAATDDGEPTPIYPGMQVICIDLASAGVPIQNGEIYIVRHTLDGGKTFETVLRRAAVYVDRIELSPESTQPGHEKFLIPANSTSGENITVYALVFSWVYNRQRKKNL